MDCIVMSTSEKNSYSSNTAITKIKCFENNQIYISYCYMQAVK